MTFAKVRRVIGQSLWFVPVVCVVIGAAISFGTIAIDRAFDYEAIPPELVGGPDAAAQILATVATSMVSLTALVLTVTMVVVQLAMGQFSPRIVQRILQDKPSQFAIGLFVATFVHAILALREVKVDPGQVPGIAVVMAFVLVLVSIAVLVVYVHHIGRSLRVSALIELVGRDTRALLDRVYPDKGPELDLDGREDDGVAIVRAPRSGVVTNIEYDKLVDEARRADVVLDLVPALGEFVPADAPLFRVEGGRDRVDADALQDALIIELERTLDQDVAYGMRLLVDIAERSMADSPLQDPTTAVQAIDRLHDLLRQLSRRPFPDGQHRDADGTVRLRVPVMSWEAYVRLAFEEIRLAGAGSPQVTRRLMAALRDLRSLVADDRAAAVDEQIQLLEAAAESALEESADVAFALTEDREGMGVAAGGSRATPRPE